MTRIALLVGLMVLVALAASGCGAPPAPAGNEGSGQYVNGAWQVTIKASKNALQPNRVSVRKGDDARILVASTDVAGTFTIDAFNVKAKVEPGKTSRIEFTPGRGGDFPFRIVGSTPGAAEMKGTLVVVP